MRREDEIVAASQELIAQPVFHQFANQAALGMPENQAGAGFVLNAEEIELDAQLAMIAALGFFEAMEIFVEFGLREKARAVDALHLRVAFLAFPVGAGNVHQFEGANASGGRDVRAAAEIDEFSGGVEGHHRLGGFFFDELAFENLIPVAVELEGFRFGEHLAFVGEIALGELVHLFFDALEVFGRERLLAEEFVEKAGVDGRTDAELDVGKKLEDGGGKQVRRGVAKNLQRVGIFRGEDGEPGVVIERTREIDELAIGAGDEGFAGESVRDVARDFGGGGAGGDLARGAVGQGDADGVHDLGRRRKNTLADGFAGGQGEDEIMIRADGLVFRIFLI